MKKFIVPLLTAVMVVSMIFTGCIPGAAPPVTPPPVTPPPVTPEFQEQKAGEPRIYQLTEQDIFRLMRDPEYRGDMPVVPPEELDPPTAMGWEKKPVESPRVYYEGPYGELSGIIPEPTQDQLDQVRAMNGVFSVSHQTMQRADYAMMDAQIQFFQNLGWTLDYRTDGISIEDMIDECEATIPKALAAIAEGRPYVCNFELGDGFQQADVTRRLGDAGAYVQFTVVPGFGFSEDYGKYYVGTTMNDVFGVGALPARMMVEMMRGYGEVVILSFQHRFMNVNQWENGVRWELSRYPDIEIVGTIDFLDPFKTYDETLSFLLAHPEVDGIYGTWADPPGMGAASAAMAAGRTAEDLVVVIGCEEGYHAGVRMLADPDNPYKGLAAANWWDIGLQGAWQIVHALTGREYPKFGEVAPTFPVTPLNIDYAFRHALHEDLPPDILAELPPQMEMPEWPFTEWYE